MTSDAEDGQWAPQTDVSTLQGQNNEQIFYMTQLHEHSRSLLTPFVDSVAIANRKVAVTCFSD